MEENLKQRLVGAAVLVALAVIFLPALFDRDERVAIDTTTQIPTAPVIEPVVIPRPTKPENIKVPPAEKLFQPTLVDKDQQKAGESGQDKPKDIEGNSGGSKQEGTAIAEIKSEIEVKPKEKAKPKPAPKIKSEPAEPRLNAQGSPLGWVVQAASFKSKESADNFTKRLLKAKYKAYSQSVDTAKGEFFRVLIGPYLDEQKAIDVKRAIDKTYKLRSRVLRFNPISGD